MTHLERVTEFQLTSGHTVRYVSDNYKPTVEELKLRIALIQEELKEFASAVGLAKHYNSTLIQGVELRNQIGDVELEDTLIFNKEEALDALGDLEVVVLGGYCISGFTDIASEAFHEIMDSNMSKFCKTLEDAHASVAGKDDWYFKLVNGVYVFFRKVDNKIMKGISYFKVNFSRFFKTDQEVKGEFDDRDE